MFRPISRLEFTKLSFVKAIKSIWPEFLFAGQQVKVEWNGSWWDALVREIDGEKYLIHYVGFDSSWDEWVHSNRIKTTSS